MVKAFIKKLDFTTVVTYVIAVLLGIAVASGINYMLTPEPWKPLGPYPEQKIIHDQKTNSKEERNVKIPLIHLSDKEVTSVGTKCSKEDVIVKGYYGWRSIIPGGFQYDYPSQTPGRRAKGCQEFEFTNSFPGEVIEWAQRAIDSGKQPEVFLTGCETPQKKDGTKGVEVCWRTEPFALAK